MDTKKLRQKILDLAIHGKLVPQDPNDEPASVLLERILKEKEQLIKEGKIKAPKKSKSAGDTSHYPKEGLPIGWVISDLDSLCTTINGLWKGEKEPLVKVGVIRNANFTKDFTLDYSKIEYIDVELSSFEKRNLENGDIIVEKSGGSDNYPVGRSILYQGENGIYSFSNFTMSLRIVDKQALLPKYLYYVLQQKYRQGDMKHMQTQTTGLHNLLSDIYLSMPIPIPPREEQERIVDSIDCLLNVVSEIECTQIKCVKEIESAKAKVLDLAVHGKLVPQNSSDEPAIELLKRINPDFKPSDNLHYEGDLPNGWCLTFLNDLALYGDTSNVDVAFIGSDSWILELEDIEKDTARIIDMKSKTAREVNGVRHSFKKGQILYSKLRTYLNKVLIAPSDGFCTTEIVPVTASKAILPDYLLMVMRSPYFLDYTATCGYGVKMPRLGTNDAKKAIIPLPPLAEQKRIVGATQELFRVIDGIRDLVKNAE